MQRRPVTPGRPSVCRGRLAIGYRITGRQLRCTVEVARRTETMRTLTTLIWAARLDGVSYRVLLQTLRAAARQGSSPRLHVFAAAARNLFRHASKSLAPGPRWRAKGRRAGCPTSDSLPDPFTDEAAGGTFFLPGAMLAAARDLRSDAHLRPRVTITDRRLADRCVNEAVSALHGLFDSCGRYLEQALQPLWPHVSPGAVRGPILETRGRLDDLAACCVDGDVYVENLTERVSGDSAFAVKVAAALGTAGP